MRVNQSGAGDLKRYVARRGVLMNLSPVVASILLQQLLPRRGPKQMPIPLQALELENRSIGKHGEATLAEAYAILKGCWEDGSRDREVGLHLMFIAWYGIIEPAHITGFHNDAETEKELNRTLSDVHYAFESRIGDDAEMLYAFGLAAHMFWFMFENSEYWQQIAAEYAKKYRKLSPDGLDSAIFKERGAYGEYYGRMCVVDGGY